MLTKNHSYSTMNNSPWPMVSSMSVFNLALSLILFMKFYKIGNILWSATMLFSTSMIWWLTVKSEMNKEGSTTEELDISYKMSMLWFISSEILFFLSMFWAYVSFKLVPEMALGSQWPPLTLKTFDAYGIPLLNTFLLATSGATLTVAHKMLTLKKKNKFILWKIFTIILGMTFSFLQYKEYESAFFSMSDSVFGSTFFMLTGFHGLHVLIGTFYLFSNLAGSLFLNSSKSTLSFEMSAWYWHFVDAVWMIVYILLYISNN